MEITVRVEVQYNAPEHAQIRDMLRMFRTPVWVRFMVRYISPHLKNCAPVKKDVLDDLDKWQVTADHPEAPGAACVICMADATEAIELPCGHRFHRDCIESWFKMRSTCPTCRHQLPKAFSGCYAVRTLNSALLLKEEHRQLMKEEVLNSCVGKEPVRAIVNVTLGQVAEERKQQQFPCVLNALMVYSNGEVFADADPADKVDPSVAPVSPPSAAAAAPLAPAPVHGRRRRLEDASSSDSLAPAPSSHSRKKRTRVSAA